MEVNNEKCVARVLVYDGGYDTWLPFGYIHKYVIVEDKDF